jgi:hypothetical protein
MRTEISCRIKTTQTGRNTCRRARHTGEFGNGLQVVPVGDDEPAWRPSPEGSVRVPARLLPLDVVSNRRGQTFCGRLEAEGADHCGNVGSAGNLRGRTSVIRAWIVPPIVIPILIGLGLMAFVTLRAFH